MKSAQSYFVIVLGLVITALGWCSEVSACGGIICRWCAHHRAAHAQAPAGYGQAYGQSIPQQMVVHYGVQGGSDPQRLALTDLIMIFDAVSRIRPDGRTPPPIDRGQSTEMQQLNAKFDALSTRVEQNATGIAELVKSEKEVANRVQDDFDKLTKRVSDVEGKLDAVNTKVDTLSSTIAASVEKSLLRARLDEKKAQQKQLEEQVAALGKPRPTAEPKKSQFEFLAKQKMLIDSDVKVLQDRLNN